MNVVTIIRVKLSDVKSSQHDVLSDYDTTGDVNEFVEMCKCILFRGSLAALFWDIFRSKPYWVNLATTTIHHGAKISFVS